MAEHCSIGMQTQININIPSFIFEDFFVFLFTFFAMWYSAVTEFNGISKS